MIDGVVVFVFFACTLHVVLYPYEHIHNITIYLLCAHWPVLMLREYTFIYILERMENPI